MSISTKSQEILATVTKPGLSTEKVASIGMSITQEDGKTKMFDAVAFKRSPSAMSIISSAALKDELRLIGHWEENPRSGYTEFICDGAFHASDPVPMVEAPAKAKPEPPVYPYHMHWNPKDKPVYRVCHQECEGAQWVMSAADDF
jgi:hypothetical protein